MSEGSVPGAFDEALVQRLFPLSFSIDEAMRIVAIGDRWHGIDPKTAIGADFDARFEIERPTGVRAFPEIAAHSDSVFLLTLRERPQFKFRGQFVHVQQHGSSRCLFVGGPWITRIADLSALGLGVQDFPPHDPRGDLLILLQTQESTLADLKALTARLRQQMGKQTQLESQIRQIQKMELVGRFAGGMAHNFNNILMAIHGYAALALSRIPAGDQMRPWVEQIRSAADHAAQLTRELLALSRQHPLRLESLDLSREIGEAERLLRPLLGERITLSVRVEESARQAVSDSAALKQIVMNLALNARDAMPDGGALSITVAPASAPPSASLKQGDFIELRVTDTGVGMDESVKSRIFEPFFTTKEVGKGVGLGLSSVYGLVEQIGGSIQVESEVGKGTTFSIALPRVEGYAEHAAPKQQSASGGRGERILLVEDEPLVRRLLEQILTRAGYQVSSSLGAEPALEIARRGRPFDLLITDVVMPGMSGPDLARAIESHSGRTPVIFMSGYTEDAAMRSNALKPHQRYFPKPFAPPELLAAIRELLGSFPLGASVV